MRVAAIHADGFRNLNGRTPLSSPLAVLLGPNNAGKSNLVDACRILFRPEAGPRARRWITADDFAHDGLGTPITDRFDLEAELVDLSAADQARMVTCLAPSLGAGCARLRMRANLRPDSQVETTWMGGDSDHPDVERWARDAVTFTYLHPLRDAAADLRPGRDNRLSQLLGALAPHGHADRDSIVKIIDEANRELAKVGAVKTAKTRVQDRLSDMTGKGTLGQRTDLLFADPQFERVVATLRALAGSIHPLEIAQNGLGYNNLLYMSVLLSALAEQTDAALRVLLVEEPEAHLHPQLQDLLMRYLEDQGSTGSTQVIVTSHSPNFASAARVERITAMTRAAPSEPVVARSPSDFGLTNRQLGHLRRFLDVTKSSLLFARGAILVEGTAEQLLVPALAQRMGRPLARSGVAVVNVGGVAFDPFRLLFGPGKLPFACAIISDSDPPDDRDDRENDGDNDSEGTDSDGPGLIDVVRDDGSSGETEATDGAAVAGDGIDQDDSHVSHVPEDEPARSAVATALLAQAGGNVGVFLADKTLEWDLAAAGNWDLLLAALEHLKPRVANRLRRSYPDKSNSERADALLATIKKKKGEFAQHLVDVLEASPDPDAFAVPDYLRRAIEWVTADQDATGDHS